MLNSRIYTQQYFLSPRCEGLIEFRKGKLSVVKKREIELLSLKQSDYVLDVGCGRGDTADYLKKKNIKFKTVDYSKAAVYLTRKRLGLKHCKNVILADARKMKFKDNTFDKILLGDVIEHMKPEEGISVLNEIYRVLKNGGVLVLHTAPNIYFKKIIYPLIYPILKLYNYKIAKELKENIDATYKYHVFEYSLLSLKNVISKSNFNFAHVWVEKDALRKGTKNYLDDIKNDYLIKLASSLINHTFLINFFGNDLFAVLIKK